MFPLWEVFFCFHRRYNLIIFFSLLFGVRDLFSSSSIFTGSAPQAISYLFHEAFSLACGFPFKKSGLSILGTPRFFFSLPSSAVNACGGYANLLFLFAVVISMEHTRTPAGRCAEPRDDSLPPLAFFSSVEAVCTVSFPLASSFFGEQTVPIALSGAGVELVVLSPFLHLSPRVF